MDKVDVIIVGAGLAGLSCAWALSDSGMQVLCLERGDHPGAKNLSGGRMYLEPVRGLCASLFENAPFERRVVRETLTQTAKSASTSVDFTSDSFRNNEPHSVTVLRSKLDKWIGEKLAAKGVFIIPKSPVDDLVIETGRIVGVKAMEQEIRANVVVAADGALSFTAEKAGLRKERKPVRYALGIKEIIELPREKIEDRFNLEGDEGAARLFSGAVTNGMMGGAFIYTNLESLSIGIVVGMQAALGDRKNAELHALLDAFKKRPEVSRLVSGGKMAEYGAHSIPEGGINGVAELAADGILAVGDAAGFVLNLGITVRGMEYAVESGRLAAEAIKYAHEKGDYSADTLGKYKSLLGESFVMKDMETFKYAPSVLENPRIFGTYPETINRVLESLFTVPAGPKKRLWKAAFPEVRKLMLSWSGFKNYLKMRNM